MTTSDRNFHYVYVLESIPDGKRYIGMTTDLRRRFQEHNAGKTVSTARRRPFSLVYYEAGRSYLDAKNREQYFKTTAGRRALAKRLRDYVNRRDPKLS